MTSPTPRDRPRTHEAGRELDAIIAEKVMRWREVSWRLNGTLRGTSGELLDADEIRLVSSEVPHYSTDIAAAWEVVEKIVIQRAASFHISFDVTWFARFADEHDTIGGDFSDTAPHAICLAALRALTPEEAEG